METENTPKAKARFFALYLKQPLVVPGAPKAHYYPFSHNEGGLQLEGVLCNSIIVRRIAEQVDDRFNQCVLELTPLSQISDEDAIEVARIVLSKDKDYKPIAIIRWGFITRILVNKEQSNADENTIIEMYIDITFDRNEVSFTWEYHHEKGIGDNPRHLPKAVKVYDYLRSKGYYVGDGTEIEYGWVKLKTK